jgi:hypothetical protein
MCFDVLPVCPDCKQCGCKHSPYLKVIPSRKKCEQASKKAKDSYPCGKVTARTVYGKNPCFICVKKMEEQGKKKDREQRRALIQRESARIEMEEKKTVEDAKAKEIAKGRKEKATKKAEYGAEEEGEREEVEEVEGGVYRRRRTLIGVGRRPSGLLEPMLSVRTTCNV